MYSHDDLIIKLYDADIVNNPLRINHRNSDIIFFNLINFLNANLSSCLASFFIRPPATVSFHQVSNPIF